MARHMLYGMPPAQVDDFQDDGASFRARRQRQLFEVAGANVIRPRPIFWVPASLVLIAATAFVAIILATGIAMLVLP
jgi:hypothetical protein